MTKHNHQPIKKKIITIIIDGWGIGEKNKTNAFFLARPKFLNSCLEEFPHAFLKASEDAVALPKNQPGNSEVGHLTIGCGKKVLTGLNLINEAINNGKFKKNELLIKTLIKAKNKHTNVHLIGICSNGNVHGSIEHLIALVNLCNDYNITPILDLIADGRDSHQTAFLNDFKQIKTLFLDTKKAKLGTISGRYYAMDRNQKWDLTLSTLNAINSIAKSNVDPIEFINSSYQQKIYDENLIPTSFNNNDTVLKNHDTIIFFNFRSDRIRQLIHLLRPNQQNYLYKYNQPHDYDILTFMDVKMIGISQIIFEHEKIKDYLGKILHDHHLSQLRIAETEKYAHVTYFFDGLNKIKFDDCDSILIPSPNVDNYAKTPKMSAHQITDYILNNFNAYDFILVNFANCDMLGHTGDLRATIKAIKYLDKKIKQLYKILVIKNGYEMIITSDHGNCDEMCDKNGKIIKAHSLNCVPFIILDKNVHLKTNGSLANVAPTILSLMGIKIPTKMEKSLLEE